MDDLCFIDGQSISMNYSYSCCLDFYEADLMLIHENASQIKYHLEICSNGTWYKYDYDYIDLRKNISNNSNYNLENTTSGFEITLSVIGILFIIYLKNKTLRLRN